MAEGPSFARIEFDGRPLRIEYDWVGTPAPDAPLVVFLHEGLGSRAMWRDFPAELCAAAGVRGLVYSRPGYGRSTPRPADERWGVDFMHRQAQEVLPAVLAAVGVEPGRPVWLFGHSDGGSISALFAAAFPERTAGLILLAPHLFVEDVGLESIRAARQAYLDSDLKARLARHHDDPDSAFWGWNDVWLDPAFRAWNIEAEASRIAAPALAIQGQDDQYGTLAQIERLADLAQGPVRLLKLDRCGHSPHRDRPEAVLRAAAELLASRA